MRALQSKISAWLDRPIPMMVYPFAIGIGCSLVADSLLQMIGLFSIIWGGLMYLKS